MFSIPLFLAIQYLSFATSSNHHHHQYHRPTLMNVQIEPKTLPRRLIYFRHKLPGNSMMELNQTFDQTQGPNSYLKHITPNRPAHEFRSIYQKDTLSRSAKKLEDPIEKANKENQPRHNADKTYSPFDPRFPVDREEATDEDWKASVAESLSSSGLMGRVLRSTPSAGLVNINFGTHNCVHMGTLLKPSETAYAPTRISYPHNTVAASNNPDLYTLIMIDVDRHETLTDDGIWLNWMVINIRGQEIKGGHIVSPYQSPVPNASDSTPHRYVVIIMRQTDGRPIDPSLVTKYSSKHACSNKGRANFDLDLFRELTNLPEPESVNYFTVEFDSFVNNINNYCIKNQ